jgi:HK97 family phage major capsid protein/HK97 family phage prohead protease
MSDEDKPEGPVDSTTRAEIDHDAAKLLAREQVGDKTLHRSFELTRGDVDEGDRRIEMTMSSEEPVERWFGIEILDHGRGSIELDFMESGRAPMLLDHDTRQQIGVVESVTLDAKARRLRATARFGKRGLADDVFSDVADGIRGNVSIGYRINEMVMEERNKDKDDTFRAVKWQPMEVSIVSIPADRTVGVDRGEPPLAETEPPADAGIVETDKREQETMSDKTDDILVGKDGSRGGVSEEAKAEFTRQREDAVKAAQRDAADITELGAKHNQQEMARNALRDGKTIAEFRGMLLDVIGNKPLESQEIGAGKRDIEEFSMMRLFRALADPQSRSATEAAGLELEMCRTAADMAGRSAQGTVIPVDVLNTWGQRDLNTTDDANIVFDDTRPGSFIEILRNASSVMQAGATRLTGLQGDVKIPKKLTTSSPGWVSTEGSAVGETEPTFGQVPLAPKLVGGFTDVTRQMLQQSSLGMEGLIRSDLAATIALAIDLGALEGSGASGQPTGIKNTSGINAPTAFAAANPTFAEVVAMETAVAEDNALMGNLAYILDANMRGALKTTEKATNTGMFVYEDGRMNGYSGIMSNQVTSGDLYFGNFSDLLLGFWGGLDILVDPYTASTTGTVRIVAMQTVDAAVRNAVSFAVNNDGV